MPVALKVQRHVDQLVRIHDMGLPATANAVVRLESRTDTQAVPMRGRWVFCICST